MIPRTLTTAAIGAPLDAMLPADATPDPADLERKARELRYSAETIAAAERKRARRAKRSQEAKKT